MKKLLTFLFVTAAAPAFSQGFEITALAASERSAGKPYGEVAKWRLEANMPDEGRKMTVVTTRPKDVDADIVFSARPAEEALKIEAEFAKAGCVVSSNASAWRMNGMWRRIVENSMVLASENHFHAVFPIAMRSSLRRVP